MPINLWPIAERPREKLLTQGATTLSDAELLAIFIRSGIKGKTALDIAYSMLNRFGNLRKLLDAEQKIICQARGFGKAKYAELQAALEISRRHLAAQLNNTNAINNAETAYLYFTAKLRNYQHEVFAALFLDNQNRVLHYTELFHGTINHTSVYPREIIKKILELNAAGIIFAHNHISGTATPSSIDKKLTQHLQKILAVIEVKVLDHIIIGENSYFSFAKEKMLCHAPTVSCGDT